MSSVELPKMAATFMGLFKGETDEEIRKNFDFLDISKNGELELMEFIMIIRVFVFKDFSNINELINHLTPFKKERWDKKSKKMRFECVLPYKIIDDFTIGTPDDNKAFMAQFRAGIVFLDKNKNNTINLDEVIKVVRRLEIQE